MLSNKTWKETFSNVFIEKEYLDGIGVRGISVDLGINSPDVGKRWPQLHRVCQPFTSVSNISQSVETDNVIYFAITTDLIVFKNENLYFIHFYRHTDMDPYRHIIIINC